jgi:hypothetical protein
LLCEAEESGANEDFKTRRGKAEPAGVEEEEQEKRIGRGS